MEIFHASKEIIKNPKIIEGFRTKDFGFGFYCTNIFKQAEKWGYNCYLRIIYFCV